jgi:hypothetical protein
VNVLCVFEVEFLEFVNEFLNLCQCFHVYYFVNLDNVWHRSCSALHFTMHNIKIIKTHFEIIKLILQLMEKYYNLLSKYTRKLMVDSYD